MWISNIQRMSLDDGPGIRTTLFVKGCPLRCKWCHNPECMEIEATKEFLQFWETGFMYDGNPRNLCSKLVEDAEFYKKTDGGVTISGGEPLLFPGFVAEIGEELKKRGISVAVDTCGAVPWSHFQQTLSVINLVLYDLKMADSRLHKKYTGMDNEQIWGNFYRLLETGTAVWVRIPVIEGVNEMQLEEIAARIPMSENLQRVDFLPYHRLGISKYEKLNIGYMGRDFRTPREESVLPAAERLRKKGIVSYLRGKNCLEKS